MAGRLSATAQAAYQDLLRAVADEEVAGLRGTPTARKIKGRTYWYDRFRVGSDVHERYVGPETPELRARLDRVAELRAQGRELRARRTRLIRILRAEGMAAMDPGTGSLVNALSSAGVFRLGGTLVGTLAFRLYEGELGIRLALDDAAMTQDIDIASFERLSLALADAESVEPNLAEVFRDFDFDPVPGLDRGRIWKWRQTRSETLIEFLTPSFDEAEDVRELPALGVCAQSLHHLNYLIAGPIPAVALYRSGVPVQVPRPERFAIHKLIVADRRRGGIEALKARKDRAQAALLVGVLAEDRPDELAEAWEDARGRGPRWRERLDATLGRMPETRALLERVAA